MITIISTPGAADANSYASYLEVNEYFEERTPITPAWVTSGAEAYILTAARMLDAMAQTRRVLVPKQNGVEAYYRVSPTWTGSPAGSTQRMAWPRSGMFNANGYPIDIDVIPDELKQAQAELAGYLLKGDTSLPSDVQTQGLTHLSVGSVRLAFRDNVVQVVIPQGVYMLMPASWLTEELFEPAVRAEIIMSPSPHGGCGWETW